VARTAIEAAYPDSDRGGFDLPNWKIKWAAWWSFRHGGRMPLVGSPDRLPVDKEAEPGEILSYMILRSAYIQK
jgi:hypothetical protein